MSDMAKSKADRAVRLQQRKEAVLGSLPAFSEILRGSFFERSVRCGKPSCHCASGEGHPRAYVGVTFAGGRTEQLTVPRELIPLVRRWVANYQRWWRAIERVSQVNRQLLRERLLAASPPGSERRR
jgi:hypothetical protein